jgi:Flp pilus assembly protein TadD
MLNIVQSIKTNDFKAALFHIVSLDDSGLYGSLKPVLREWMNIAEGKGVPSVIRGLKDEQLKFLSYHLMYQQALMFEAVAMYGDARKFYRRAIRDIETVGYRPVYDYLGHLYDIGEEEAAQLVLERYQRRNMVEQTMMYEPVETIFSSLGKNPKTFDQKKRVMQGIARLFVSVSELLSQENMNHEALINAYISLYLDDELPDARMVIADILSRQGKSGEAVNIYEQIPAQEQLLHRLALIKLLYIHGNNKEWDKSSSIMRTMERKYPLYKDIYIARGDTYRKMDKFEEAIEFYTKAIDINAKTVVNRNDWVNYYVRGICYEQLKRWPKAEADFVQALKLAPEQPQVMNYLAYSWVERGEHLEEATNMLLKALEQQPDDPHILDSVGWSLFKQGKFTEALEHLDKAADLLPSNAIINEHLGDTLWKLKRRNEARFQWRKALQFDPEEGRSDIITHKIDNGMTPIENDIEQSNAE